MYPFVRNIEVNSLINIGQRVFYACQVVVVVLKYPFSVVSFQMVKSAEHQAAHFLYLGSGRDMPIRHSTFAVLSYKIIA